MNRKNGGRDAIAAYEPAVPELDGIYGLAMIGLDGAKAMASSDPLGAAIHARLAAACFAYLGWEDVQARKVRQSVEEALHDAEA